ncbi:hypothetical protein PROAA_330005 [Candidatus Propionivibrio aalborgensis]|uniref:Uncharacterized protein n=1 Tax=Candidatus Propionivibrio aalborgensis TaxID=1860101 RepID=A0A1A8XXV2_9RHOO|nr:hypothetical protein PROAA_330005 [Candidatus Propionivibrio aalborgensis]
MRHLASLTHAHDSDASLPKPHYQRDKI